MKRHSAVSKFFSCISRPSSPSPRVVYVWYLASREKLCLKWKVQRTHFSWESAIMLVSRREGTRRECVFTHEENRDNRASSGVDKEIGKVIFGNWQSYREREFFRCRPHLSRSIERSTSGGANSGAIFGLASDLPPFESRKCSPTTG